MSAIDLVARVEASGHLARTRTLLETGTTRRHIATAIGDGALVRVMPGWVATAHADRDQFRAIRAGGRIGCVSALARWGLWSGDDRRLHIMMPPKRRMSAPPSVRPDDPESEPRFHPGASVGAERGLRRRIINHPVVHWSTQRFPRFNELEWIVPPAEALLQAVQCEHDLEQAVACADSALHDGVVSEAEWERILELLPQRLDPLAALVDPRADSGLESRIRVRLELLGHTVEIQVSLPDVGRLDVIVDGLVILELDGDAYHATRDQRRRDARRMLVSMSRHGLPTLRAGYGHAIDEWDLVYSALTRLLALARDARSARRPIVLMPPAQWPSH